MLAFLRDWNFLRILLIILLIIFLYPLLSSKITAFHNIQLKSQDAFFKIRYNLKKPSSDLDDIIIISIADESFEVLNKRWPWSRDLIAILIEKLKDYSPSLICLDLAFIGESEDSSADEFLTKTMREAGNVIIASHFSKEGKYILSDKGIRESAIAFGFVNKPRDKDFLVRRAMPVVLSVDGDLIDYSFGLKIAAKFMGFQFENISYEDKPAVNDEKVFYEPAKKIVTLKRKKESRGYTITLNRDNTLDLNYLAKPESFKTIPFWKVVAERVDPGIFKDKIVMVGVTAEILHDIYHTPLGLMSGLLLNANEVSMYINKNFLKKVSIPVNFILHLLLGIGILVITYRFGSLRGFLATVMLLLLAFLANIYLLIQNYSWDFFGAAFILLGSYLITYGYNTVGLLISNMTLRKEAITDGLTGLYIYRYFNLRLQNEFSKARQRRTILALLILDIDHFKEINDTYSHEDGNIVLKELAKLMTKSSRGTDIICRYGGEEFCIITANSTPEKASGYAEKIRRVVAEHDFVTSKGPIKVTVSIGVATTSQGGIDSADSLMTKADEALYKAKGTGRNKIILSQ